MRLIGLTNPVPVTGNISAVAYKKLCRVLSPLSKDELWKVLDHYIFHCMDDSDVDELVSGLESMQRTGVPLTAEAALGLIDESDSPFERSRYLVASIPTIEDLEASKQRLDLLFDENFFQSYLPPILRNQTAHMLITFCQENKIPTMPHWTTYIHSEP